MILYIGDAAFISGPPSMQVTAIDTSTAKVKWQTGLAGVAGEGASLQRSDEILYVTHATSGSVFSSVVTVLDPENGDSIWQYQPDNPEFASIIEAKVFGNILYTHVQYFQGGNISSCIEVRHLKDTTPLWRQTYTTLLLTNSIFTPQVLYCLMTSQGSKAGFEYTLHALRSRDGKELWQSAVPSDVFKITATDQAAYLVCQPDNSRDVIEVLALSSLDGSQLWKCVLTQRNDVAGIFVFSNIVYVYGNWGLIAMDAQDGRMLWEEQKLYSFGQQVEDTVLYALHSHEEFCALNPQDGKPLWCTKLEEAGSFTVSSEDVVYTTASFSGVVHALDKRAGSKLCSYESGSGRRIFGLALR